CFGFEKSCIYHVKREASDGFEENGDNMNFLRRYGLSIGLVLFLLILWETKARLYGKPFILPSPVDILVRLWELRDILFINHLPATLAVILIGLFLSLVFGAGLSIWMHESGIVR